MTTSLTELMAALREAEIGSPELDCNIVLTLGLPRDCGIDDDGAEYERLGDRQHFTRSIDDSLTLLQEGWWYGVLRVNTECFEAQVFLPDHNSVGGTQEGCRLKEFIAFSETAAIAIVLAALEARAALSDRPNPV